MHTKVTSEYIKNTFQPIDSTEYKRYKQRYENYFYRTINESFFECSGLEDTIKNAAGLRLRGLLYPDATAAYLYTLNEIVELIGLDLYLDDKDNITIK